MKQVSPDESWPESWKYSYKYDLLEVYGGGRSNRGYSYGYLNRARLALELVRSVASPPASVLDVAAAQGNMTLQLAELGYQVSWNDLREDLAGYVELKREFGNVDYFPGNLFELEFPHPFDVVLLGEVIEHVAHPDALLRKVHSLLRPGGHVVMTTPNGQYFRNRLPKFSDCPDPSRFESEQFKPDADGHIFLLHPDELRELASTAGFRVDTLRLFTNPLTNGHLRTGRLLDFLPEQIVWLAERSSQRLPGSAGRKVNVQLAAVLSRP